MQLNQKDIENRLNTPVPDYYQAQNSEQTSFLPSKNIVNEPFFSNQSLDYYFYHLTHRKPPIKTGFKRFDSVSGGLYTGVSVLGGTSGTGKTAFACQIAYNVTQAGVFVLFLSLEMKDYDIFERIAAIHANPLRYNIFNDTDYLRDYIFPKYRDNKYADRISINDLQGENDIKNIIEQATFFIDYIKQTHGEEQEILIIIDHLQMIENTKNRGDNAEFKTVNDGFKELEKIAKNARIKILCLSQLNRQSYGTVKDSGVLMQDFKGASRIEQGAVLLFGLTKGENSEIRLNICKNRYFNLYDKFIYLDFNGYRYTEKENGYLLPIENNQGGGDDSFE